MYEREYYNENEVAVPVAHTIIPRHNIHHEIADDDQYFDLDSVRHLYSFDVDAVTKQFRDIWNYGHEIN